MSTTKQASSWLLAALRRIRPAPGMYLGDYRLNSLACYVYGMFHAPEDVGVAAPGEQAFLAGFGNWLGQRIDQTRHDCWFYLASCIPGCTGQVADFYRELDAYLHESGYVGGLDDEGLDLADWRPEPPK
jgi:hypothetical protein